MKEAFSLLPSKKLIAKYIVLPITLLLFHTAHAETFDQLEQQLKSQTLSSATNTPLLIAQATTIKASNYEQLKQAIHNQFKAFNTQFTIQYSGSTSQLGNYLDRAVKEVQNEDGYIGGTYNGASYKWSYTSKAATIQFTVDYHATASQEKFVTSEVSRLAKQLFTSSMSDFEKAKAVNDYIVLNTTYSENTATSPHNPYAILKEGKGVCQAYALLTYRLLKAGGMDVRYVTGYAGEEHAWNLVKVDGKWYHLDTTWNDPVIKNPTVEDKNYIRYKYFLIPDSIIQQDHKIDKKNYPKATDSRFVAFRGVENPLTVGSVMYYANDQDNLKLYKMDLNARTLKAQKVSDTRVQFLAHHDDWLYFSNYSNGGYLAKMRLDGSSLQVVREVEIDALKIERNKLTYKNTDGKYLYFHLDPAKSTPS